jgi:DNA-binding SARP family transcriptional activator
MITKEAFNQWKSDVVTKLFYSACEERVEEAKEILANQAGMDPIRDSFYRGFIYAYREMQSFDIGEEDINE